MKLSIKLTRSLSSSPPSSSPPSPRAAASCSTSPTSPSTKSRFSFPHMGRSRSKKLPSPSEILEVPSSCKSPTFSSRARKSDPNYGQAKASLTASARPSISLSARHGKAKMSETEMHEIQQVFAQFDTDGDGKISAEELRSVLALLGDETTSEEAVLMVREVDLDGDGYIDMEEFVQLNARCLHGATEEEEMKAAFAIFDLDKNGWITAEELQAVLQRLGGSLAQRTSVEDCKRMIRGVDRKGVGHVDFDDFKRMMTPFTF